MAKGNGGTRSSGTSTGGIVAAPVDQYAAWRERETSERYSLNPDKVRFSSSTMDMGNITAADMRLRGDYEFSILTKDMDDGKYHLGDSEWLMPNQNTSFSGAIKAAVEEAKNRYIYAGRFGTRDSKIVVETEDGNLSAWIDSEMTADNKVKISITRFKL